MLKGYINYFIIGDPRVKSYNFNKKSRAEVDQLEKQFMNPTKYHYVGSMVVSE